MQRFRLAIKSLLERLRNLKNDWGFEKRGAIWGEQNINSYVDSRHFFNFDCKRETELRRHPTLGQQQQSQHSPSRNSSIHRHDLITHPFAPKMPLKVTDIFVVNDEANERKRPTLDDITNLSDVAPVSKRLYVDPSAPTPAEAAGCQLCIVAPSTPKPLQEFARAEAAEPSRHTNLCEE